jgi:gluconolactonase
MAAMGAAGATAIVPVVARAQAPPVGKPAEPLSTITTPPRDFGPNAPPTTYVDPDVITVDPLFNRYRQGNTPIKRLWTGALWGEGPA